MVELDEDMLAAVPITGWSIETADSRAHIAEMLTNLLEYWLGPVRQRTLARLELYLDATRWVELKPELATANQILLHRAATGMRAAGIDDPQEAAHVLVAQLDGLLYDALARPFLGGDNRATLRRAVDVIVRGHTAAPASTHARGGTDSEAAEDGQ